LLELFISFTFAVQIFILAPLGVVAVNNERSPISIHDLFGWPLGAAAIATVVIWIALRAARSIVGGRITSAAAAVALLLLVQYHFLVWDFGLFDGHLIDFSANKWLAVIEAAIWLFALVISAVFPSRFSAFASRLAVFFAIAMLGFLSWQALNQTQPEVTDRASSADFFRDKNVHDVLSVGKRNAIILLADTMQSDAFSETLRASDEIKSKYEGFTIYENVSGHFPYTGLSVPAILSGQPYDGERSSIPEYLQQAGQQRLDAVFEKNGLRWGRIPLLGLADFLDPTGSSCRRYGAAFDAAMFRQLPIALRPSFYADGQMQFERRCSPSIPKQPSALDLDVLRKLSKSTTADDGPPKFIYVHLWGAHPPASLRSDCQITEPDPAVESYKAQIHCVASRIGDYIERLREVGAFEQSLILIIADHGSRYGPMTTAREGVVPNFVMSAANPTIAIHFPKETGPAKFSGAPVTQSDIYSTILKDFALGGHSIGRDIQSIMPHEHRERGFLNYKRPKDVYNDYLPQAERFLVAGDVRDPSAWSSLGVTSHIASPVDFVDFVDTEREYLLNMGWSAEPAGASTSWITSNPATISGLALPSGLATVKMRIMNPHPNQKLTFRVNNRVVGELFEPQPFLWAERSFSFSTNGFSPGQATVSIQASEINPVSPGHQPVGIAFDWIKFEAANP